MAPQATITFLSYKSIIIIYTRRAHRKHGVGRDSQYNVDRCRGLLVGVLEGRAGALSGAISKAVPCRNANVVRHSRVEARYHLVEGREGG